MIGYVLRIQSTKTSENLFEGGKSDGVHRQSGKLLNTRREAHRWGCPGRKMQNGSRILLDRELLSPSFPSLRIIVVPVQSAKDLCAITKLI